MQRACLRCNCLLPPGEHPGTWFIDLKSGSGSVGPGEPPVKADVVMTMDSSVFSKMFAGEAAVILGPTRRHPGLRSNGQVLCVSGKLKPTMAFMSGTLRIKGDVALAIKLEKLMGRMNKAKL